MIIAAHIQQQAASRGVLTAKLKAMNRKTTVQSVSSASKKVTVLVPERVKLSNGSKSDDGSDAVLTEFMKIVIGCVVGGGCVFSVVQK